MVYHGVEDDDDGQGGVVSREGHPATEVPLVYHVHIGSKKRDFGHTIKRDFQQKKCLAGCCQRVPLCPISRKKNRCYSSLLENTNCRIAVTLFCRKSSRRRRNSIQLRIVSM